MRDDDMTTAGTGGADEAATGTGDQPDAGAAGAPQAIESGPDRGDVLIADIMERQVVTIAPDATVHDLVKLLQEKDLGGVPVVEGERLVGIVTEGDLVIEDADVRMPHYFQLFGNLVFLGSQKKFEDRLKKMVGSQVRDVMTTDVQTVAPDEPAGKAANIMVDQKVDRVPVVDGDRLVGIVARHDIIKMLGL